MQKYKIQIDDDLPYIKEFGSDQEANNWCNEEANKREAKLNRKIGFSCSKHNMKYSLELHYSVHNGGDGSAYPHLMSSKELAQYDQDNMDEGWGESCLGSFTVESDSPIFIKDEVKTPEGFLIDLLNNEDGDGADKFIKEFFPNGKPKFEVKTRPTGNEKYLYNDVFVDDKQVAKNIFRSIKDSGKAFEELINK